MGVSSMRQAAHLRLQLLAQPALSRTAVVAHVLPQVFQQRFCAISAGFTLLPLSPGLAQLPVQVTDAGSCTLHLQQESHSSAHILQAAKAVKYYDLLHWRLFDVYWAGHDSLLCMIWVQQVSVRKQMSCHLTVMTVTLCMTP